MDKNRDTIIGTGKIGGKARGLFGALDMIESLNRDSSMIKVVVPQFKVISTSVFDDFMKRNHLYDVCFEDISDEMMTHEFLKGELSPMIIGRLYQITSNCHVPLAVRSSAIIEDNLAAPFAGVFETKMISNNQKDGESRFQKLLDAIKYVYASLFFKKSKDYFLAVEEDLKNEKMAVLIQEVHGNQYGKYFYPAISGVGRSYNFYPGRHVKPENGIVSLALGLGKTIVDGGTAWTYSPPRPKANPPFNSIQDMIKKTQTHFWVINLDKDSYDPVKGTEFMSCLFYEKADKENVLNLISSYYDSQNDRLEMGSPHKKPRIIDFSPILKAKCLPFNDLIKKSLKIMEEKTKDKIEIEFTLSIDPKRKKAPELGILQIRPMASCNEFIDLEKFAYKSDNIFVFSDNCLGNGQLSYIKDIVYVKKENFDFSKSKMIAREISNLNHDFILEHIPYLLIGFGRWGSSDPNLGIPVNWSMIAGAKIIVETNVGDKKPDLSQGSHFFHNIFNLKVFYYCVQEEKKSIDWSWLEKQPIIRESQYVKHIRLEHPINALIDGRTGKGVLLK